MPAQAFIKQGSNIQIIPGQALQVIGGNALYLPYAQRVAADGGTMADANAMKAFCEYLNTDDRYQLMKLAWNAAGGYKTGKLYSLLPTNGSGDFAVSGNTISANNSGLFSQNAGKVTFKTNYTTAKTINVMGTVVSVEKDEITVEYSTTFLKVYKNETLISTKSGNYTFSTLQNITADITKVTNITTQ